MGGDGQQHVVIVVAAVVVVVIVVIAVVRIRCKVRGTHQERRTSSTLDPRMQKSNPFHASLSFRQSS